MCNSVSSTGSTHVLMFVFEMSSTCNEAGDSKPEIADMRFQRLRQAWPMMVKRTGNQTGVTNMVYWKIQHVFLFLFEFMCF